MQMIKVVSGIIKKSSIVHGTKNSNWLIVDFEDGGSIEIDNNQLTDCDYPSNSGTNKKAKMEVGSQLSVYVVPGHRSDWGTYLDQYILREE